MATSAASVILIQLHDSDILNEASCINLGKLKEMFRPEVVSDEQALVKLFKSSNPKVLILADNALALPENEDLRQLLYEYLKAGGTVILACQFAIMCTEEDLDTLFKALGLPMWTHAIPDLNELKAHKPRSQPRHRGNVRPSSFHGAAPNPRDPSDPHRRNGG